MAQGFNTCFRNLPPLSSDSRTLNVPLDSEDSLAHHLESLIEHSDLSNTVVSPENISSDLNLSSNFFSNSNTSSDFVQQKYYDDVVWQDEGQPVQHEGQFNHTSNSLFSPARAASSSNCLSTSGADLNPHDLKQECDLLNPSIPEDYSDVSSCSESDVDRTGPSCEMLKHGSNDSPLVADDKKENECAWKSPKTNTGSPESMSTSESEVEEDQDEPPEKEKETFMMQENKYSETSGAPESLSVSEDEGEKDHLDGEAHEKDETCMEQDGQHTDSPSGAEESLTASVNERKEELDDEAQNAEEGCMEEEDRYSNVSSLEGQNEGTIVSESFKEKEEHSLSKGTMDSQGIDASNAQDSAHKLNDNTCAFEYQDSVKDNDSLKVAGQENGKSSSVICGLGLGGSNQTFESCLEFPGNQSLKTTRFQEIVSSGTQSTNSTYEESASDSIRGSGGKEDHSSFDFLERCLGLNNSGIEQKSCIKNEWLRPIDESNVLSCLEEDQASQQNLMRHIEPPDLVRAGLENTRETFHKVFTADDEQEPPVLSECYGEPLSREDCMSDTEGNQERGETGSIDSTELNQEGGDSTIANIEDESDFEDQAAQLKSSLHMRKCMHPIVLLRNSELKNDTDGAYQCAACQQATQSIDHLIEHHHCNHSENKFNFCQTCGTYLTCDSLAKKHQCGIIDENAQLSSNMKPQKRKSTGHALHKCRYCTQTFYRLCDYSKHVQSHSGRTEHKCHRCGCTFSQCRSLNRHLCEKKCRSRSSQVPVKQIQTTPRISIYKKGTVHPYVLPPNSPYADLPDCFVKLVDICKEHVCRLCGKSFASSAKLYKHGYNVHHTKTRSYNVRPKCQNTYRSYKCQKCLMTFNYSSNFSRHKKRCKGAETNEKFKCPLCPRLFKYSYNRSRHLREQCIKDFIQGSSGKVDMKFRCPFCTTTFTNASNRHRHIRLVCLKEYIHNETSRTKAERQENMAQKETQKPPLKTALNQNNPGLKCNYCPAVFAHSSGKYRHMRKHKLFENTGKKIKFRYSSIIPISNKSMASIEEPKDGPLSSEASSQPFSCLFCGKWFNTSYSLKKHICSMHMGDKPYRCLECGKRFGKEIHLVSHKKVHQRRIQCTVCKKILPTIGDLIQHRQSHIKKGMLQCPDCPSQFQYPVYLLRHMASHHKLQQEQPLKEKKQRHPSKLEPLGSLPPLKEQEEEEKLGCPICPEVFHSGTELSSHCLNHVSESSSSQCPFCKRLFSSRTSLVRHIRIHTGEKPFSCLSCGEPFRRKEYLQLHQEKCPGPQSKQELPTIKESEDVSSKSLVTRIRKVYKCSYCPREFEKLPRLLLHHNGHMQNTVTPCPKCGKCYRQRRKLHERLCNGSNIKSIEPVSTVWHPCRNCGRKFSKDYNRDVHERICNSVKPLQKNTSNSNMHPCKNCGKYFTRSDNRNFHEKTCNSAKPLQKNTIEIRTSSRDKLQHKCPHCPSKFKYRSFLLRHIGSHTGERSYPCMHCGHSYGIQSRCLQHEAFCDGVNREKPPSISLGEYKCNICTKIFMKSRNLRRHILTHTEVKPYRCKACDSCFSRHDHLKLHQSRCKGKRQRLEVRIAKISLADVGRGWQNNLNITDSGTQQGFDCSICSKIFPSHSIMARHIAMSHAIRTVSSFTHEKSLKRHINIGACQRLYAKTKLSEKLNVTSPPSRETNRLLQRIQLQYKDKRKFKCTFCPRLFKSGEQLRVHTRLHTGEKPFGCSNCGERFIRRDYLQRHFNRCKGEPLDRVLCDRCGDVFSQDELENHQLTCVVKCKSPARSRTESTACSPPKGFSCANCSARFLLFSQLQQHFLNTHRDTPTNQASPLQEQLSSMVNIKEEPMDEGYGDTWQNSDNNPMLDQDGDPNDMNKPIKCPQCNLHFGNKGGFARHMHTHLGEYPFNCKKCNKGFWNKNLCRTHVRKCRLVKVTKEEVNTDSVITSELDPTLKETVLVFNQGSKTTGTGVLQTNFSCKDDLNDLTLQNSSGNQGKGRSSNDRRHSGQQVPVNKYQCSECDRSFTDGLLLISHLEDHGREELERKKKFCQPCGKTFANPSDLARHMRGHWNEKTFSCPECPQTFPCPSDLDIHRTCHDSNRPFVCKECQQRFWTSQSLENHQSQAHSKELIHTCHVCNKNYSIRSSLVKHIRMKHQTQKNMDVVNHVKEKETAVKEEFDMEVDVDGGSNASNDEDEDENDANEDNDSDSADYFPCHVCGKTFTTSESLEDHQRCHLGEKPHECAECGKCFFQAGQLQQHLRSHKSEYQCQICGRGFVSLFALRKHKHTHGKSRQHRCSKCPLSFTGPSQLAEHMGTHRDDNFPCDICDRTFSCKMSRAEHRKIHTETEDVPPERTASPSPTASSSTMKHLQYRCGVCNERFKEPEQLSEHGCMAARERPYSCHECNKHFLQASHLNKHELSHYQIPQSYVYRCNQCHMSFNYRHNFVSHLNKHGDDEAAAEALKGGSVTNAWETVSEKRTIYKCPICPHRFAHAIELASHLSIHSENTFACSVCKLTFPTKSKLAEHERSHLTAATQYECTECGQSFLGSDFPQHHCARRQHAVTDHERPHLSNRQSMEDEVDVGEDFFNCTVCLMRFSSRGSLQQHLNKEHHNERPFKCQSCGKTFALKRYLRDHERRQHKFGTERAHPTYKATDSESQYKCSVCPKTLTSAHDLSLHMKVHTEQESGGDHRCDMCYKSFSRLSLLRQHQESHVGQVVYECTECDKAFAFPHLLEEHQKSHAAGP
ncbi:uncharacterized protein LOC115164159 [Salmo trutta]|nr:uncharacterized protein LOC115164159 [Salmo trutta]